MQKCFCWLCILSALLALLLITSGGTAGYAQPSPFKTTTLSNGLDVIVIENKMVPLATIELVAKNGSFTEPPEYSGLSHLYEHMFFKANKVYPSQEKFLNGMAKLGASLGVSNASTNTEHVNYFIIIPKDNLKGGMQFMSDAIREPLFDTAELRKERHVVTGEFDRNEASPLFRIRYAVDSALWTGALFSRKEPLGLRSTILSATPDMMRTIQHRFYIPNNMALVVAGDVKADDVFRMAESLYGSWQRGADPFPTYNPPAFAPIPEKKLVLREAPHVPYTYESISWHGPSLKLDDPGSYAADVFFTMLNQPNSTLQKKLVDAGLAYQVQGGYYSQHNVGPISLNIFAPNGKAVDAIKTLMTDIRNWGSSDYYTDAELQTAKKMLEGDRIYEQESASEFATRTVPFWWASHDLNYYNTYISKVKAITRDDIRAFLNRYIIGKNYILGVASTQETLNKLNITPAEVLQ